MRRIVAVLIAVVATGCTGGSHKATTPTGSTAVIATRAERLCRATVPDPEHLVSSDPTTVGAIRGVTIATVGPSQTHSFPTLTESDFGAWCWTKDGGIYSIYKAAGTEAISVAGEQVKDLPASRAHGAPSIP
jgi:hypothetical protein